MTVTGALDTRRRDGRMGDRLGRVPDPVDEAAVEVRVVQVAVRTDHEVDGVDRGWSRRPRIDRRVGDAVGAGEQHPEAVARVVHEEQRAVVAGRERGLVGVRRLVEREAA